MRNTARKCPKRPTECQPSLLGLNTLRDARWNPQKRWKIKSNQQRKRPTKPSSTKAPPVNPVAVVVTGRYAHSRVRVGHPGRGAVQPRRRTGCGPPNREGSRRRARGAPAVHSPLGPDGHEESLDEGDALHFAADVPHSYRSADGCVALLRSQRRGRDARGAAEEGRVRVHVRVSGPRAGRADRPRCRRARTRSRRAPTSGAPRASARQPAPPRSGR